MDRAWASASIWGAPGKRRGLIFGCLMIVSFGSCIAGALARSTLTMALLLATLLFAAPAVAQVEILPPGEQSQDAAPPEPDPLGELMTSEELRVMHSGKDLAGCYLDRPEELTWRERNGADGRLYDLMKGGAEVGRWWVEPGGIICFRYTDRDPGPHCFVGRRRGAYYDFYSAFGGGIVGTTQCIDPEIS